MQLLEVAFVYRQITIFSWLVKDDHAKSTMQTEKPLIIDCLHVWSVPSSVLLTIFWLYTWNLLVSLKVAYYLTLGIVFFFLTKLFKAH